MATVGQDISHWLSITEETLFLHDGLSRVTDLVELPHDVTSENRQGEDHELVTFDTKDPEELCERLRAVCGNQNNAFSRLLEYRLNALRGLWNAQLQNTLESQNERDSASSNESLSLFRKGLWRDQDQSSFSTRVSLLLVLPLLQSQSKYDPAICGVTAELLVGCLQECPPLSLSKEPSDCLGGLEGLLCSWLGEGDGSQKVVDATQRRTAATALVALACARGHLETIIHSVHLLQNLEDQPMLPVSNVMNKLLDMEGGVGPPAALLGNKHVICWGFEDVLSNMEKEPAPTSSVGLQSPVSAPDPDIGRSLACDGKFIYFNSNSGKGVIKLGTGLQGTLRGYIYIRNCELPTGWLAYGDNLLIHRPHEHDKNIEGQDMLQILDLHTLKPCAQVEYPKDYEDQAKSVITTISMCSDGLYFYWLWCYGQATDKPLPGTPIRSHEIFLDIFEIDAEKKIIRPLQQRVALQKKEEAVVKTVNESLLNRLRPYRSSSSGGGLVALTASEPPSAQHQQQKKEEAGSTTIGIPLQSLVRAATFCDGNCIVIVTSPAGTPGTTQPNGSQGGAAALSAGRFSFGATAGISGLRSLASSLCFNILDGQCTNRTELMEAPVCVLARGAPVAGMSACFDPHNNLIWTGCTDWVDQWINPGLLAPHHIRRRLLLKQPDLYPASTAASKSSMMSCPEVIHGLLQHVGFTSVHQQNEGAASRGLGGGSSSTTLVTAGASGAVKLSHLRHICDILQHAIGSGDTHSIICVLVRLQLLFKTSEFQTQGEEEEKLIKRTSELIWQVLHNISAQAPSSTTTMSADVRRVIINEFCEVINAGLTVLYPQPQNQLALMHKLLTQDDSVQGLNQLRDLLLVEFAEQLRNNLVEAKNVKYLRLTDELISLILKIAVKESNYLLRQCQTTDKAQLDKILASVPVSSPCLRYLTALQAHLMRDALLGTEPVEETALQAILNLTEKIFSGAYEVLETVLETSNFLINSPSSSQQQTEDLACWVERVTKATLLGQLLPTLLTAMTHPRLHSLASADTLMPQLVTLVLTTSQAALLLKSQVDAIHEGDLIDLSSDTDIADLIGQSISIDSLEENEDEGEELGFLAGLKIPAPWTSGKTVESVHPVRDNYRYKNTVHIPGARCLYLRFDPRCTSQYDYDKLVMYAGPNTSSRKVAEYGGNTFGYGSRSVLGSGWPKDLVKIDGDTVTFSFEMRSGREHNTPDKAMWGFLVTVRAREAADDPPGRSGLPFLADLALSLSVLACTMLHLLYQGPEISKDEEKCQHVLHSKLLQRCVWQSERPESPLKGSSSPSGPLRNESDLSSYSPSKGLPRVRLPTEVVKKLRELSGRQPPQIRPSIKEVIKPEVLEESVLSAAIKHLHLQDTVRHYPSHEEHKTEEHRLLHDVMAEIYKRIHAMFRQLQNIAELEQKWRNEVDEVRQNASKANEAFFIDYHLIENKSKELVILCFLQDVDFDPCELEKAVSALSEKLVSAAAVAEDPSNLAKTRQVVNGLLERIHLLLQVTIAPDHCEGSGIKRSMSNMPEPFKQVSNVMVRSDTDVLKAAPYRSHSTPADTADDCVIEIARYAKKHQHRGPTSILQDMVEYEDASKPPHVLLLDQLFSFIGSNPEKAVSSESFLAAARVRCRRGSTRKQALIHMKELLTAAARVGGATHLIAAVTSVLQHGPRVHELTCGGQGRAVRDAFAETLTSVVGLAARRRGRGACCTSVGLLCTVPYTRADERCLVRSGLLHLLDKLCSMGSSVGGGNNTSGSSGGGGGGSEQEGQRNSKQRIAGMAWAGFQVLSNRCVSWEQDDGVSSVEHVEHSGLARQVSSVLTNHLARATEACSNNAAAGSEALGEVLALLNNLARSRMGKAILSQPECVSKLLSLLLDQSPSPKLSLMILQLCRVALPLLSSGECEHVQLPAWGCVLPDHTATDKTTKEEEEGDEETPYKIASLLLAKLGDFLVPDGETMVSSRRPSQDMNRPCSSSGGATAHTEKEKSTAAAEDVQAGRIAVFVHKRDDQSSHEVIQPLLSCESRPFRLSGGANMEKVVRMDGEMTKTGKAEVTTEDAVSALRKAAKWAQMGLVVSTGPPMDTTTATTPATTPTASSSIQAAADKKKNAVEVVCREKNGELARSDPVRPFISGHVANSMAAEVIGLLNSLLTAPETMAAQLWASAVEKVLSRVLSYLPALLSSLDDLSAFDNEQVMCMAKLANAGLAALGGFDESIKPGCKVQILGDGIEDSPGVVVSVSEQTGLATVELTAGDKELPRYSDNPVQVPLARLTPPHTQPLPVQQPSMTSSLVWAIQSLLLPAPSHTQHQQGAGNSISNQIARLLAQIKTRASKVLSCHLKEPSFARTFIEHSSASIDFLKGLASECSPGERLSVVESQCCMRRMLYRDCAKPPPPPTKSLPRPTPELSWCPGRSFPPVRSAVFSAGLTGVTFLGDPSVPSGLPRGLLVYASQPLPPSAPSFYWELEICSFGDLQDESGPFISFGFMPAAEKKDGGWTQPVGSCLFHNNGRAVHYNGSSLLLWKSVRLDVTLNSGDTAGIGWQRHTPSASSSAASPQGPSSSTAPSLPPQPSKGSVYFTHNGRKLQHTIDDVAGAGMWPVVHIQKKNTRIRANFGGRPFLYAAGEQHRSAADDCHSDVLAADLRDTFRVLPFHLPENPGAGSDSEGGASASSSRCSPGGPEPGASSRRSPPPPGPPCRTPPIPKPLKEYNSEECLTYKLLPCYENLPLSGQEGSTGGGGTGETESDLEDTEEGGEEQNEQHEDHYILLVKAWEQKVFPTIRRRFRNEAERKDGLEQIRGALQLGMTDIARQTVEFLYEENGGMPRDLHLPTIDDIKEELAKFTIDRVRKGTLVVIRTEPLRSSAASSSVTPSSSSAPSSSLAPSAAVGPPGIPKFAVRSMLKTFGLMGTVLDVNQSMELVQVETYLHSEGVLVRFWYPIDMLERPPAGYRKSSVVGSSSSLDTANIHLHKSLLELESTVARMYCRAAFLELINQCNSPAMELASCSTSLGSAMAASTALLQELDVENLKLLSTHSLADPTSTDGCLGERILGCASPSPWATIAPHTCSMPALLYRDFAPLAEELRVAIARAANQGEDYLIELTNQTCMCLQTAPEMFPYEQIPVLESKVSTDIHFPGAAFLVVSCRADGKAAKKDVSLYKSPWARIFVYRGRGMRRSNGSATKQEVVSYPRDCSSTSNSSDQYAPAVVPADLIHIRTGVAPAPGVTITVHAFPPQFALALGYIEVLVSQRHNFEYRRVHDVEHDSDAETPQGAVGGCPETCFGSSGTTPTSPWRTFDSVVIPPPVLLHVTELLGGYLWRSNVPAFIKEYVFHLLAQTLRIMSVSESSIMSFLPTFSPKLSPTAALLVQLQTELNKLYEQETKNWPTDTNLIGTGIGLGIGDSGRFSTYFHALMEVCLAIAEVASQEDKCSPETPVSSTSSTEQQDVCPISSSTSLPAAPSSPMASSTGKRKKLKAKRERQQGSATAVKQQQQHQSSSSRTPVRTLSEGDADADTGALVLGGASSKPEEILWFHRALTMSQILRYLLTGNSQGESVTYDAVVDAAQSLNEVTAYSRLLVISGIPCCLSEEKARSAIRKACNSYGGLYNDELYLPAQELEIMDTSPDSEEAGASASSSQSQQDHKNQSRKIRQLQGFAIVELRSRAKVEMARQNLTKNQALLEGLTDADMEFSEESLSISGINQALLADALQANTGLESYLRDKLITNKDRLDLSDGLVITLTEIFHSCFISEQRVTVDPRQESGYICLGREQITYHTPGNLMYTFFSTVKAVKKSFHENVKEVLRRYGVPKVTDKDDSDKKSKTTGRKSSKPSKEKLALATKTSSREKNLNASDSAEKMTKDSVSSESLAKVKAKEAAKEDDKLLTLDGFMNYVTEKIRQDVRSVWQGLFACGYDLHFERSSCIEREQAWQLSRQWTIEMDTALVSLVNKLCVELAISPARLHPHEIYLTQANLATVEYSSLQGVSVESLRLRFALLQSINNTLESFFFPLVDLRPIVAPGTALTQSIASLLALARPLVFYDNKMAFVNRVLNATASQRRKGGGGAPPEVTLDPLQTVSGEKKPSISSTFCQALRQLSTVSSSNLCVRLASGGDPTYAFNVKFTGEEVHGTSGSFRHFLSQVAREIESSTLGILLSVLSSHKQHGKYLLKPGPLTFAEEKMLQFFGQLLAITLRADIPLGLDLLPVFWKNLADIPIDPVSDLQEADPVTYSYLKKFELVESEEELAELCAHQTPTFVYNSLTGEEVELFPGGGRINVNWENRQQYVDCIRQLRAGELRCTERMRCVKVGLASIAPLQTITGLLTPHNIQSRLCGQPYVNLDFLRHHTMYQVGLTDTDPHIQYFWNVLEAFSADDLAKFIKFACNQERLPQTCPCRQGGVDTAHVPPFPMKIAPPDGPGTPDSRHIRVETCMFMIKLPQYSSEKLMKEHLLYAIHCREDPLSG